MSGIPLHLQVAEALGLPTLGTHERDEAPNGMSQCVLCGAVAHWNEAFNQPCVLRYDTDWSATGPLIEKFKLYLYHDRELWVAQPSESEPIGPHHFTGATPLLAVCNLIVALAAAGRLR